MEWDFKSNKFNYLQLQVMHFIGLLFINNWYGQYFRVPHTIFVRKEEDDYEILPNSES